MFSDSPDPTIEADLIRRIRQREGAAVEELHDRYASLAFSLANRIVRDPLLAEEVVQDVFLQAWRDAELYDHDRGSVRAWLLVITRARALDRLRSLRARDARLALFRHSDGWRSYVSADQPLDSIERSQQGEVGAVLAILAPEDQRLMALAFGEGLSHAEIADRLREPLGTVKTRLRRALRLVRAAITGPGARPFRWHCWPERSNNTSTKAALNDVSVVVVDDHADTLRLLVLVLQRAGATVMAAGSAEQAFKRVSITLPDVLLTDIEMPGEDGYDLLHRVRRLADVRARRLPAIAFTAHGSQADGERSARAGFSLHIPKPIRPSHLVAQVAALARAAKPMHECFA